MFIWPDTQEEFHTYDALRRSITRRYKIHSKDIWIKVQLNGVEPQCECGCGQIPKWRAGSFQRFINGHNSVGQSNPMFGKNHSKESKNNISQTRKEKFANGEYEIWQHRIDDKTKESLAKIKDWSTKENNPERAKKISNKLKGRKHSEEHNQKSRIAIKKAWESLELKEQARYRIMERFKDRKFNTPSKLEIKFKSILESLNIEYVFQYNVSNYLFDFYLPKFNTLIEVDGNFYHCHPILYPTVKYETQQITMENDYKKNKVAGDMGYELMRFWEYDINTSPLTVISRLSPYKSD